jgi:hypothetical protein
VLLHVRMAVSGHVQMHAFLHGARRRCAIGLLICLRTCMNVGIRLCMRTA